jgi:hypothetical protein
MKGIRKGHGRDEATLPPLGLVHEFVLDLFERFALGLRQFELVTGARDMGSRHF